MFRFFSFFTFFVLVPFFGFTQRNAEEDTVMKRKGHITPCSRYWSGHMAYSEEPYTGIKIIRKGNKQIETNPTTGAKTIFKIKWNSDCKYDLTFVKSSAPSRFKKGWKAEVEITNAYEEFYEFKSDLHGIVSYGVVTKELSPSEKKAKRKAEADSIKQAFKDSVRIARGDTLDKKAAKKDSLAEGEGKKTKGEGDDPENPEDKKEKKNKGKVKEGDSGDPKTEGKKEKAPKEKKEKKEKVPKEKKEKAPKEKKEKVPKEKKEKPEKEE